MIIKCRICQQELNTKGLTLHLKTHSINFNEYLSKYLEDFANYRKCEICGTPTKFKHTCSIECCAIWKSKNLIGDKSPRYGKQLSNKSKKKISSTQKKRLSNPENHPMYGKVHTDEYKTHMSKVMKGLNAGIKNGMFGKTHTPEAIEKIFKHKKMNKLEKCVADWLDSNGIEYTFQFFINHNRVCKSYDFKLKNSNTIIEVHGDYWHGGIGVQKYHNNVNTTIENDKIKKQLAESNGYNVFTVWEHELKKDISILSNIL